MLHLSASPELLKLQQCPRHVSVARLARHMSHCSLCRAELNAGESFCPSSCVVGNHGSTTHVLSETCMENHEAEGDVSSSSGLSFTSALVWLAYLGFELLGVRIWHMLKV